MMLADGGGPRDLDRELAAAQADGLESNMRRWLSFLGIREDEPIELQALGIGTGNFVESRFAFAIGATSAVRLAQQADNFQASGVYVMANAIDPAVATRATPNTWNRARKGESTTDADIVRRRVLYVDIDAHRVRGTSATDAQVAQAHAVALSIFYRLEDIVGDQSVAMGHSGNGRAVFVRLDDIPADHTAEVTIKGILSALEQLHEISGVVEIDTSVSDAKRLMPAFGTTKRKGARGIADHPHRVTSFVGPPIPRPVSLSELELLLARLRYELSPEQNAKVDKAMGVKVPHAPAAPATTQESPFRRANELPVGTVLDLLGLREGERPRCPGCGESDSGVAVVENGLKCSHNRCTDKGYAKGFRTVVDLVSEVRQCRPTEALDVLREWFPGSIPDRPAPPPPPPPAPPRAVPTPPAPSPAPSWGDRVLMADSAWYVEAPPRREWLLRDARTGDGVLPLGKAGSIIGEGGVSKTMAGIALGIAVATGERWLGTFTTNPGRVLLVLGEEDPEEVRRRIFNVSKAMRAPMPPPGSIATLPLAGVPCAMIERDGAGNFVSTAFVSWLRSFLAAETADPWRLVIVDPLSRFAGPDGEKDNAGGTVLVQNLESFIGASNGATVIAMHHTNKASRAKGAKVDASSSRGATSISDGFRWVAALVSKETSVVDPDAKDRLGDLVTLSFEKSNYSRKAADLELRRSHDHSGALVPLDDIDQKLIVDAEKAATSEAARAARVDERIDQIVPLVVETIRRSKVKITSRLELRDLVGGTVSHTERAITKALHSGVIEKTALGFIVNDHT